MFYADKCLLSWFMLTNVYYMILADNCLPYSRLPELKTLEWSISRFLIKPLASQNPRLFFIRIRYPRKKHKIQPISVSCYDLLLNFCFLLWFMLTNIYFMFYADTCLFHVLCWQMFTFMIYADKFLFLWFMLTNVYFHNLCWQMFIFMIYADKCLLLWFMLTNDYFHDLCWQMFTFMIYTEKYLLLWFMLTNTYYMIYADKCLFHVLCWEMFTFMFYADKC